MTIGVDIEKQMRLLKMVDEIDDYAVLLLDRFGNIENWNRGAEKMTGYRRDEIVNRKNFSVLYTQDNIDTRHPEKLLEQAINQRKSYDEGWLVRKDGSKFWASVSITAIHDKVDNVIGFTKVTKDLTSFIESRQKLKRSEDSYYNIVAEVQDYSIISLDLNGIIENWNKGSRKMNGYAANEVIGKHFSIFHTEQDKADKLPEKLLSQAISNGRVQDEGWRMRKDGDTFWASVVITALHDEKDNVTGFLKVIRDLTDRMLADGAIRQYTRELENKNKELEQFVYIASHDLQEPLRTISSFTELLQSEIGNDAAKNAGMYTNVIAQSSERMRTLIKGLLDYSRIGHEKKITTIDCNKLLDNVCKDLAQSITESGAIIYYTKLPEISGYETAMRQLFQNLISNAIKFRKKGIVPNITISAIRQGNTWKFKVEDNGIGMDNKFIHKIFLIFQQLHTKSEYEGSGIGLAHCKKIVDLHKGEIWAESTLGEGSTFYFTIPTSIQ